MIAANRLRLLESTKEDTGDNAGTVFALVYLLRLLTLRRGGKEYKGNRRIMLLFLAIDTVGRRWGKGEANTTIKFVLATLVVGEVN